MSIQWTTQGSTLALKNLALLVCRARFAGKLVDVNAMSKCTTLQS